MRLTQATGSGRAFQSSHVSTALTANPTTPTNTPQDAAFAFCLTTTMAYKEPKTPASSTKAARMCAKARASSSPHANRPAHTKTRATGGQKNELYRDAANCRASGAVMRRPVAYSTTAARLTAPPK